VSATAYDSPRPPSRQRLRRSVTARWPLNLAAPWLLIPAGLAALLVLVYLVAHGRTKYAVIGVGLAVLVALLPRSRGAGFLLAVGVLLVIPYWYAHVWLVAPIVVIIGLTAGRARTRFHPLDLVFAAVVLIFTASWLVHPELRIPLKHFEEGILPLGFYLWARLSLDQRTLPRLLLVMLVAGAAAAGTVLYETARGSSVFVDPLRYQWAGTLTNVFRAGGVFGGSPTAATVLAMVLLATIPVHRQHPKTARVLSALILAGVVVTLDRAGYLGLIVGALLFAILLPYRRWLPVAGLAVILLVAALVVTNLPSTTSSIAHSKLVTAGLVRSNTISYRESLLADAVHLIDDSTSHLLFGRGFDAFEALSGRHDLHMAAATDLWIRQNGPNDDYVRALLEQGLVGLLAVVGWLLGSLALGLRACLRQPSGSASRMTLAALSAATVCFVVASTGHDMAHNVAALSMGALITGTLVSTALLPRVRSSRARTAPGVPPPAVTSWRRAERPASS